MENTPYLCERVDSFANEVRTARCIFIFGDDHCQKDRCFKRIFEILDIPLHDNMNSFLYYGDELSKEKGIDVIFDTLNSISFDLSPKTISIKFFEALHKEAMVKLAKFVEKKDPYARLILVSDKQDTRFTHIKSLKENSLFIETSVMKYPRDLMEWVGNYVQENRLNMDYNARRFFSEYVALDTYTALNEMKKLQIYIGNSRTITINDIKECTVNSKVFSVFSLTDAVGGHNKRLALEVVENLIANGESVIMIVAMLTTFFFTLWRIRVLLNRGISDFDIKKYYLQGMHPYMQEKNIGFARNYDLKQIQKALSELYTCDCRAKLSMGEEKVLGASMVIGVVL